MDEVYSETEVSIDSLEDENSNENKFKTKTKTHRVENYNNTTIPYYKGEVLLQNIKTKPFYLARHSHVNSSASEAHNLQNSNLGEPQSSRSYYSTNSAQRIQSARVENKQRKSRRRGTLNGSSDLLRSRHRSVSYAEQFRKKLYGVNKVESSTFSIAGSEISDHKSLSCNTYLTEENRVGTSEYEFYEDLIANQEGKQLTSKTQETQQSNSVSSTKSTKILKQNQKIRVILPKVNTMKQAQEKMERDKKNALEKRMDYANKVKVRNQIRINQQKEKDRLNKFKDRYPEQHIEMDECLHHPLKNGRTNCNNYVEVPFTSFTDSATKSKKPAKIRRPISKIHQKEEKQKTHKHKLDELSKLSMLQKRHESEKHLVDSIRNLVLKT